VFGEVLLRELMANKNRILGSGHRAAKYVKFIFRPAECLPDLEQCHYHHARSGNFASNSALALAPIVN
jgi:hypothetical protein